MNTKALHANKRFEPISGDVMPPLHLSTTYKNDVPGESEYFYGRVNNPSRELFERTLASLEGVENYEELHAFAMASGMSAVSIIAELAKPGDNVVITKDVYGGTTNYFRKIISARGVEVNFCDFSDHDAMNNLLNEKTKLAWIESPSNPSMKLYDLQKISEIVHQHGTLLVADSTFSTPFITRPFEHGVDIIMHSTTKYIGGHSDTLGGAVLCKEAELHEELMLYQRQGGAIMSPFDSYLVQRGLYTLGPRIKLHSENAHKLAEYLETSEHIKEVRYPGLKNYENHEIAVKQMDYFGGMMSFYLEDSINLEKFWQSLDLYKLAVSLGGVETLIELPYLMTHDNAQDTEASAPTDIIRISVGLENVEDLIEDMDSALNESKK
ncbi:MAG: aminotransferase class V-fold PLP-dependent enzyme [Actinomycetota bacterium]|nr:aminotransferase class V-fold PLP-dependent enzyme [Actinomycetota bacterium]